MKRDEGIELLRSLDESVRRARFADKPEDCIEHLNLVIMQARSLQHAVACAADLPLDEPCGLDETKSAPGFTVDDSTGHGGFVVRRAGDPRVLSHPYDSKIDAIRESHRIYAAECRLAVEAERAVWREREVGMIETYNAARKLDADRIAGLQAGVSNLQSELERLLADKAGLRTEVERLTAALAAERERGAPAEPGECCCSKWGDGSRLVYANCTVHGQAVVERARESRIRADEKAATERDIAVLVDSFAIEFATERDSLIGKSGYNRAVSRHARFGEMRERIEASRYPKADPKAAAPEGARTDDEHEVVEREVDEVVAASRAKWHPPTPWSGASTEPVGDLCPGYNACNIVNGACTVCGHTADDAGEPAGDAETVEVRFTLTRSEAAALGALGGLRGRSPSKVARVLALDAIDVSPVEWVDGKATVGDALLIVRPPHGRSDGSGYRWRALVSTVDMIIYTGDEPTAKRLAIAVAKAMQEGT